jgi:hypothetical protein
MCWKLNPEYKRVEGWDPQEVIRSRGLCSQEWINVSIAGVVCGKSEFSPSCFHPLLPSDSYGMMQH